MIIAAAVNRESPKHRPAQREPESSIAYRAVVESTEPPKPKLAAARTPRAKRTDAKLLAIDPARATVSDLRVTDLPALFRPGDLLVVNDAATLPASLFATTAAGDPLEVRFASHEGGTRFRAVLFGRGDWRTPTEHRPSPPALAPGALLILGAGDLLARVAAVSPISPRLVELELNANGASLWSKIYEAGRPVQYSYLARDLALDEVQIAYAARPWSVEMPSAGRPLSWSILFALFDRGVRVRALTHAAGLSSTGDAALDAHLPLDERYELPESTVRAIAKTKQEGGRIVAAGTTVVRALEGAALEHGGALHSGPGTTSLKIDAQHAPRIVGGILSGVHEPGATHFALLEAFAPRALLESAYERAVALGYTGHEFGDSCLILPGVSSARTRE